MKLAVCEVGLRDSDGILFVGAGFEVTKEKPSKASTAKPPKPKPAKEKSTKATPLQKAGKGKVAKVRNMSLESFQAQGHAHVGGVAIQEPVAEAIRPLPVVEGKGKAIVTEEQAAQSLLALHTPKRRSTTDQFILQRRTPTTDEASTGPSAQPLDDTSANIIRDSPSLADAETGARSDKTSSGGDTEIVQITKELGEDVEKQENVKEKTVELDQDQAGSDPGETLESRPQPEQVHMEEDQAGPNPRISRVALARPDPMPTHDEFMLIYLEQTNKNLDNTTRNLGSRVYTLELRDLPHKINEVVRENVKEVVQIALQAPLRDRFKDLPEKDMKEMLHQRMFKSGTYKLLPEHIALYEALEESMTRAQSDQFLAEKDKSCKRRHDDQDPPPPPPNLDLTKRRRRDTGTSGSSQPPAPQSSAWKKSDTRDAPSSSSKQQSGPHDEQPVEDMPISDSANISDSKDTGSAHLPHVKPRPAWLKPILEDDRPATPEAAWVIPTSHIPDAENNWANALATTYQALAENSLLEKTGDMRTFMKWYFQRWERSSLLKQILKVKLMKSLKLST
ncbi:hypothetical protein Tco_1211799 [Tanacetum coccineum]